VPIHIREDRDRRWLYATITGELTLPDVLNFLRTARASSDREDWPLLVDGRGATTSMSDEDVEAAVAVVRAAVAKRGLRAHAALVADDDRLYTWSLMYETRCADVGVHVIRTFRQYPDAERWLSVMAATRRFV
jgi:hypothetical protein